MLGPIFNREWLTLPRRPRHYLMRSLSLGGLWVLAFTVWQTTVGWEEPAGINDLSRFGLLLFQVFSYVQLVLLLFFSALSAAGTISQEKDRRTFVLLLMTDLRNYEIVLGKLFGSLLQILLFLAGMVPILFLVVLLGGVDPAQVLEAALVLAMTSLAAGSLGGVDRPVARQDVSGPGSVGADLDPLSVPGARPEHLAALRAVDFGR